MSWKQRCCVQTERAAVRDNDRHFCHSFLDLPSLSHKGAAGSAYSLLCSSRWLAIAWASSSSQHLLNGFAKFLLTLVVIHIKKCPQTFVGWNEKNQDETSLCIGNKQGIKLAFLLLNWVFIGVSPPILDLPYLLLQLHCCSYSSIKLCGNKILQISELMIASFMKRYPILLTLWLHSNWGWNSWTDDSQFHETVPNFSHFMTTLKLGLKQLNLS